MVFTLLPVADVDIVV